MKKLILQPTEYTPKVIFDKENNIFTINGRLMPENPVAFFEELKQWIKLYSLEYHDCTQFTFFLQYINSSSKGSLVAFFKFTNTILDEKVVVNWCYSDETMLKKGNEILKTTNISFQFIQIF